MLLGVRTPPPEPSPTAGRRSGVRLTRRVFWDLAIYMVGFGLVVGLVFPPFATVLGVPDRYAGRTSFQVACLVAGFLVSGLSYALCRWVVGGRLAVLSSHLRSVADSIGSASRSGDWSGSTRIEVDSVDELGETAQAFNSLLDALEDGEHFRSLVRNASDVITVVDSAGTITYQTPSVGWVLGYPPATLLGSDVRALLHPGDAATFAAHLRDAVDGRPPAASVASRMRHRNGSWRWTETVLNDLLGDPAVAGIVLTTRDVSDRRELEEKLREQAYHDALTGLPNRVMFMERLRAAEELERTTGTPLAVLFLDLDNLKTINDDLGHEGGDRLLQTVAARMSGCLRADDTLARLSGDEFAVLLVGGPGDQTAVTAEGMAERILASLRRPITIAERSCTAGLSIGIATSATCAASGMPLLRAADVAMYVAKTTGKGRYAVFQPSHHTAVVDREQLRADLHRALGSGQFVLHYQPIVELTGGQVTGFEALVRWQHPERGLVPPAEFIPLAEETGLIVPIGRWILHEVCRQAAAWQRSDPGSRTRVSVNVSVRQFQHPDLVGHLRSALEESGLDAGLLCLEITESLFVEDAASTSTKLLEVKALGVRLALDDFGTGYSSLSYLRRFPIDVLKIDKAFVEGIASSSQDRAVVGAIVALGKTLELTVVAEGIESAGELEALRALGVDHGQGYHLGRPAPAAGAGPDGGAPAVPERRDPGSAGTVLRAQPRPLPVPEQRPGAAAR